MNLKESLVAATVLAGLLSASVVTAAVVVDPIVTTDAAAYSAPAPLKIVTPAGIARRHQGATIRLSLRIDETGRPRHVSLLSGRDANLERHLLPAVAQWQFKPAMKQGRPVAVDVVLPVELVESSAG